MNAFRPIASCVAVLGLVTLAACGGGGGDEVTTGVPGAATESPQAFSRYAAQLPADDTREPLVVSHLTPPTSETDEPLPLR